MGACAACNSGPPSDAPRDLAHAGKVPARSPVPAHSKVRIKDDTEHGETEGLRGTTTPQGALALGGKPLRLPAGAISARAPQSGPTPVTPAGALSVGNGLHHNGSLFTQRNGQVVEIEVPPGCCASGVRGLLELFVGKLHGPPEAMDIPNDLITSEVQRVASKTRRFAPWGQRSSTASSLDLRQVKNVNRISHFVWLTPLLKKIVEGKAIGIGALENGQAATPLFVIAGSCPNKLVGMQAMLYSVGQQSGAVDFWWLKPMKSDRTKLERNMLQFRAQGPYRNAPLHSKALYGPMAQQFGTARPPGLGLHFYVQDGRAVLEETSASGVIRMLIYLVWQEEWSSLVSLGKKFMRGKICYQKGDSFYARQYRIDGTELLLAPADWEEELESFMPPDTFQGLRPEQSWATAPCTRRNLASR